MEAETASRDDRSPSHFDRDSGILQSRVFGDPLIYRQELDSIFRRSWLFVAPENWLSGAGEFITSRMGDDEVLVWRGGDGALRVFINLCPAGHQPLCSISRGRAENLTCSCHGWRYDSRGSLSDVPGQRLAAVARVELYKGLVFANHDSNAEPLSDWLGEFAWYLDLLLDRGVGGIEAYGGDAIRWTIDANWKAPAEAFCADTYRQLNEAGREPLGVAGPLPAQGDGFQVSTAIGAMTIIAQPHPHSTLGQPRDGFVPMTGTLFPTLSFDWRTPSLHVWHPLGPSKTEIHSFCIVDRSAPASQKENARRAFQFRYGPAGLRSQPDSQLWSSITARAAKGRGLELNLQMGLGRERQGNIPGKLGDLFSECNQRAFFSWWQQQLGVRCDLPARWLHISGL